MTSNQGELGRLSALSKCRIVDTAPEAAFDRLVQAAARLTGCPMAMVGFVERERVWLKSALGLSQRAFSRHLSPCDVALESSLFSISDASLDARFAGHPLVCQPPHVRFYASARVQSPEGEPIGVLAVLDTQPRTLGERDAEALLTLAANVGSQLELRLLRDPRLLKDEALLRAAQRISGIGSWQWDMRTDEITWSSEMYKIFKQPRSQPPSLGAFMDRVHPEDRAVVQERIAATMRGSVERYPEYRIQLPDKSVRVVAASVELTRDAQGNPMRLTGGLQDVTQERQSEVERRQLTLQMLRAQKLESLGLLAAAVAHDFNNLLVGVLGNAELALQGEQLSTRTAHFVNQVIEAAEQAAVLTRQLLAYTGRGNFSMRQVDLSVHVGELGTLLRASLPKTITVRSTLAPKLPEIGADPEQLQQVTMNLILNAAESYQGLEGEVRVRTLFEHVERSRSHAFTTPEGLRPGHYVVFEVSDSGSGMNPDTIERIFEPFFSTKFTGRGLGLAAVLGIVRAHRAVLSVDSVLGAGSTFRVYFPAQEERSTASARE